MFKRVLDSFFKVHETFPKKEKESMSTRKCSAGDNPVMIAAKLRHKDLVICPLSFGFGLEQFKFGTKLAFAISDIP